jgi:hypothetical protein
MVERAVGARARVAPPRARFLGAWLRDARRPTFRWNLRLCRQDWASRGRAPWRFGRSRSSRASTRRTRRPSSASSSRTPLRARCSCAWATPSPGTTRRATRISPGQPAGGVGPTQFQWRQTAQDGVQFSGANYQDPQNQNPDLLIAPGNRVEALRQRPQDEPDLVGRVPDPLGARRFTGTAPSQQRPWCPATSRCAAASSTMPAGM